MTYLSNNPAGSAWEKGMPWQRQSPCGETPREGTVPISTGVGTADQRDTFTTTVTTPIRATHDLSVGSPSESCWTRRRRSGPFGPCWATSTSSRRGPGWGDGGSGSASGTRNAPGPQEWAISANPPLLQGQGLSNSLNVSLLVLRDRGSFLVPSPHRQWSPCMLSRFSHLRLFVSP